jgi:hypothetical protein
MAVINDTGELRHLAEQLRRVQHDPRRPGPLDFVLAAAGLSALFTVGVCTLILTIAPDEYPVEPGRVLLTMTAASACIFPMLTGMYFINRANRRRFDVMMERLDRPVPRLRVDQHGLAHANGRPLSPSEYYSVYNDVMRDLGDLAEGESV